jgi:hypothetical protein
MEALTRLVTSCAPELRWMRASALPGHWASPAGRTVRDGTTRTCAGCCPGTVMGSTAPNGGAMCWTLGSSPVTEGEADHLARFGQAGRSGGRACTHLFDTVTWLAPTAANLALLNELVRRLHQDLRAAACPAVHMQVLVTDERAGPPAGGSVGSQSEHEPVGRGLARLYAASRSTIALWVYFAAGPARSARRRPSSERSRPGRPRRRRWVRVGR